ncbi:ParA family protein [Rhodopirellula sallentina]|nr:AAA family ATPase [Rhodopirellula sallentina]
MPTVLMINLKGGVGKTASTIALAETLAEQNYRTLVIDADHQSMAGELLVGQPRMLAAEKSRTTLHDLFLAMADCNFEEASLPRFILQAASSVESALENLDVLPCSFRIDDFFSNVARSHRLCRSYSSERELQIHLGKQMKKIGRWFNANYDFVLVDCPPSVAMQVKMMMRIADGYVIPSVPDQLSIRGSENLVERIGKYGFKLTALGTLWTLYREQISLHREMIRDPYSKIPQPFKTVIPNSTRMAAAADPRNATERIAHCNAKYGRAFADKYRDIVEEMLQRCEQHAIPVREVMLTV